MHIYVIACVCVFVRVHTYYDDIYVFKYIYTYECVCNIYLLAHCCLVCLV